MTKKLEVYKCEICGNIVSILHEGYGQLVCCNKPMILFPEQTQDTSLEKHVPYIEKLTDKKGKITGYLVKIGENEQHPMDEKHYIEWIELITENKSYRKFLKPGNKPEAIFHTNDEAVIVREYCNIHGLWTNKNF
jgi:superoxide reductase